VFHTTGIAGEEKRVNESWGLEPPADPVDSSGATDPGWNPAPLSRWIWLVARLTFLLSMLSFLLISEPFAAARGGEDRAEGYARAATKLNEGLRQGRVHRQGKHAERVERVHLRWTNLAEKTWQGSIRVQCLGLSRDRQVRAVASEKISRRSDGPVPPGASIKFEIAIDAPTGPLHSISCSVVNAR